MHGSNGSLGQVWVQVFLLAAGTLLFVWVDLRAGRRRRQRCNAVEVETETDRASPSYSVNHRTTSRNAGSSSKA